jgi:hypothetical protein
VIESISRGVLDAPHARGMTAVEAHSASAPRDADVCGLNAVKTEPDPAAQAALPPTGRQSLGRHKAPPSAFAQQRIERLESLIKGSAPACRL